MAKAWTNHASMKGQSTFQVAKWLLTIMLNTYRDACRKNRLPEEWQDSWVSHPDLGAEPSNEVEAAEEEIKLHAKIAELDPDDREVILMRFWHNLTHQEIADRQGRSKAAVVRHLQRVIPSLNKAMR
jgi:RNA polymerase sigma factor (sigma-70 family)